MFCVQLSLLLILQSGGVVNGFLPGFPKHAGRAKVQLYVASSLPEHTFSGRSRVSQNDDFREAMSNITASCMDSMSMDPDEEDQAALERLDRRALSLVPTSVFRAQFELAKPIGMILAQVNRGKQISNSRLDVDGILGGQREIRAMSARNDEVEWQRMDWPTIASGLDMNFKGLLVSSVAKGGAAWGMGVRPGDMLTSVSATLGDSLWPTSTMDGVQSSLQGRKFTSKFVSFEFCRLSAVTENLYQLTLKRPLGIDVQEAQDGYVIVTGFNDAASKLVRRAVLPGDRVLAVDSSLGGAMWPVTTVAGLTSAVTSRMPGAEITLRLQRPLTNMQNSVEYDNRAQSLASPPIGSATVEKGELVSNPVEKPADKKALIKRCRNVLERYSVKDDKRSSSGFKGKYDVPAIVADKVVDALASARVSLDSMTLSMIMRAYLSCNQPDSALKVFEAATGFRADATCFNIVESIIGDNAGGFVPNESALNLYTGTALLQAHAMKGDLYSISRVLATLEGRSGVEVNGLESAPWPFTGAYGSIQPDTRCYNIAMAAAVKVGGSEGLEMALNWFDTMISSRKISDATPKPEGDVVSYNTIISALSAAGRSAEAFSIFERMKQTRVRPDKFTYTPLIQACESDGDIQELLYDMKEKNIQPDTVTYNAIIRSLCEKRLWTEASKLVTEMETRGVVPDSRTYGNLMSAMLKADKPTACLTLFESACASSKTSSLTENVYLYTTAITAASVLGDFERAIELLSRMSSRGVKPNLKTLTTVTGACIAAGRYDLAVQVYRKIENPDGYAICQGIEALSKNGEWNDAFNILKRQVSKRHKEMSGKLIMKSYETILVSALKARDFKSSEAVFVHLMRQGNIPNKKMLQEIIDTFGFRDIKGMISFAIEREDEKISSFRFLLFVLDALRSRKLPVDSYIYSVTLFLGSLLEGRPKSVASLLAKSKVMLGEKQLISAAVESYPGDVGSLNGGGVELIYSTATATSPPVTARNWVGILDQLDDSDLSSLEKSALPAVTVRVSARDRRRLVRAENQVLTTVSSRQKNKAKREELQRQS